MYSPRLYKYRDSYVLYLPKVHAFGIPYTHFFWFRHTHTRRFRPLRYLCLNGKIIISNSGFLLR